MSIQELDGGKHVSYPLFSLFDLASLYVLFKSQAAVLRSRFIYSKETINAKPYEQVKWRFIDQDSCGLR